VQKNEIFPLCADLRNFMATSPGLGGPCFPDVQVVPLGWHGVHVCPPFPSNRGIRLRQWPLWTAPSPQSNGSCGSSVVNALTARAALADHAHEEVAEAIIERLM
jgi:hypothetical protein